MNYVARLGQVGTRMGEAIAGARQLAAKDLMPPRFILLATLAQMRQFVSPPAADNPLVATFAERMKNVSSLSESRRQELRASAERIVRNEVYPS